VKNEKPIDSADSGTIEENVDVKNAKPVDSVMATRIYVLFTFLQTMTATFASFVHGGNDVRYATL
jgi:phosphate/sulfate permease